MAPARHRLVKPEFGPDAGVDVGVGVGAGARAGAGNGYESPSEDNLPPFFTSSSGATTAATTAATPAATPALVAATRRPIFVQRPSYIAATGAPLPENGSRTPNGLNHGHSLSSSLNHVMASAEKASPNHKIGIRDRIACYQWTYFTMVSPQTRPDHILVAKYQLLQTMSTGGIANILHACKIAPCHPNPLLQTNRASPSKMEILMDPRHWRLLCPPQCRPLPRKLCAPLHPIPLTPRYLHPLFHRPIRISLHPSLCKSRPASQLLVLG